MEGINESRGQKGKTGRGSKEGACSSSFEEKVKIIQNRPLVGHIVKIVISREKVEKGEKINKTKNRYVLNDILI